jgi:hypothetical protein
MVGEVNKIIAGELLNHHAVRIPGVGTLCVVRHAAQRLSGRRVAAPRFEVELRTEDDGTSLIDLISREATCDEQEAQAIFDRWQNRVSDGDRWTIEGVGTIQQQSFTTSEQFAEQLNPQGDCVVTLPTQMNRWIVSLAVCAVCIAVGCLYFIYQGSYTSQQTSVISTTKPSTTTEPLQPTTSVAIVAEHADTTSNVDSVTTSQQQPIVSTTTESGPIETTAAQPTERLQSGWSYVVFGVFSTEENARRSCATLSGQDATLTVAVYPFGEKFMVSLYASSERQACDTFMREHRSQWSDLWVYSKR